jgi:WD40 repeat protein
MEEPDMQLREKVQLNGHTERVTSVAFSPKGQLLASGSGDKSIRIWDVSAGSEVGKLSGHTSEVTSLAFSPHGGLLGVGHRGNLVSGAEDGTIRLWNLNDGTEIARHHILGSGPGFGVAYSPDGKRVAAGRNVVRLYVVTTGEEERLTESQGHTLVSFSADGRLLAASCGTDLQIWDLESGKGPSGMSGHKDFVSAIAFSPVGSLLASGSWDNTVKLWESGQEKGSFTISTFPTIDSLSFSPDGKFLALACSDHSIRIWDWAAGKESFVVKSDTGSVLAVQFSPDGKLLASGGSDNVVRLWEVVGT